MNLRKKRDGKKEKTLNKYKFQNKKKQKIY